MGAQRVILAKLTEKYANELGRLRISERIKDQLASSQGVEHLHVLGPGNRAAESSWDLAIIVYGRTADSLDEALAQPHVTDALKELNQQSECVKGWTFEEISFNDPAR